MRGTSNPYITEHMIDGAKSIDRGTPPTGAGNKTMSNSKWQSATTSDQQTGIQTVSDKFRAMPSVVAAHFVIDSCQFPLRKEPCHTLHSLDSEYPRRDI